MAAIAKKEKSEISSTHERTFNVNAVKNEKVVCQNRFE